MRVALVLAGCVALTAHSALHAQRYGDGGALRRIDAVLADIEHEIRESCDPELADKAEDAMAKLESTARELTRERPDRQAAAGAIEGAVGDVEAAVADDCFDPDTGVPLMDDLAAISRRLAVRALDAAGDRGGKLSEVREADRLLDEGDADRDAGRRGDLSAFKRAAAKYKDALAKAEGAMGGGVAH